MSFDEYAKTLYPQVLAKIARALKHNTPTAQLELVVLRLMHLLERDQLAIPKSPEGLAFRLLAAKACNECMGFIGCLRAGTFWGAHHHARAMLELYAGTNHLVCKPASRAKRFERFMQYPELALYQQHLRQRASVKSGALSEEEYQSTRFVSDDTVERLVAASDRWRKLFKRENLLDVRHWHAPSRLEDLFAELDSRPGCEPTWPLYEMICHAIHVSPIGHRTVGAPGIPVFGLPDDRPRINREIDSVAETLFVCIAFWDRDFVPGSRLLRRFKRQILNYCEARDATKLR